MTIAAIVFWLGLIFIGYTLAGYPLLLKLACSIWNREHVRGEIFPKVSVIIAAHNSMKTIANKLDNTLRSSYPREQLEIVVASDSSTDSTNEIVASYSDKGVKLAAVKERRGKHYAQRVALAKCTGEIIVFTDSAVFLDPDAVTQMVTNFADTKVGCVSSEDQIKEHSSSGEGAYVPAEMQLRRMEARVSSLVGVSGSFFAARREVCDPWHTDQSSDFFVPLHTVAKGYRAVVDPSSIAHFGTVASKSEFARKVRTINHGLVVFFHHLQLLDPFEYGFFSCQLLSHKLFRWLLPFALSAILISNFFLFSDSFFYQGFFALQLVSYSCALFGILFDKLTKFRAFRLTSFFVLSIAATVMAWFAFMTGEKFVTWEPSRR